MTPLLRKKLLYSVDALKKDMTFLMNAMRNGRGGTKSHQQTVLALMSLWLLKVIHFPTTQSCSGA